MPMTGAHGVAAVIAAQPNATVYGMPGGHTILLYDAIRALGDRVRTVMVRQESVATVMAEAHGRLTSSPAFVIGQGAWVLGNASIGVMEAHLGSSPVVILVDATEGGSYSHHGAYQTGGGGYGGYDIRTALSAITKRTFFAQDATQAIQMTQLAIKHATSGDPGPVAVVFHSRALFGSVDESSQPHIYLERSYQVSAPRADGEAVLRAVEVIKACSAPVIISGNGVRLSKAEGALAAFAIEHDIPVVSSAAGKGTFPESHPLGLGVIGAFGHDIANAIVGAADLIIAVGTKLGSSDTANQHPDLVDLRRQRLIQIDVDPLNAAWTLPADVSIVGDAGDALDRLRTALGDYGGGSGHARVGIEIAGDGEDRTADAHRGGFAGRDVVRVLSELAPADAVITCDAGENRLFVLRDFQTKPGGTVLQPNGGGGMGYAVPAAMAASMQSPGRPAIAVCGDGGISLSLHSLMTAVEQKLKVTVLVINNGLLGWVYNGQRGRYIASELSDFDYAAIARAMGASAWDVDSAADLATALNAAFSTSGVSVVVARVSNDDRYQNMMSGLNPGDVYSVPE